MWGACVSGVRVISQSACKCRLSVRECGVRVVCVSGRGVCACEVVECIQFCCVVRAHAIVAERDCGECRELSLQFKLLSAH